MAETSAGPDPITPWRFSVRGIAWRLFLTCWIVYSIHLATNTVREIFLALSIADHLTFSVDEYANLHPDIFETPGRGWHIGNNPGASMLAAIPYVLAKPLVDPIVARVNRRRAETGAEPPKYQSPWPKAQRFYEEAWKRGFDVKFGIAAIIMQVFCMGPISAATVVLMFLVLRRLFQSDRTAVWVALLYAFATPIFFRTGFINQNLLTGHFIFAGFIVLWSPGGLVDHWRVATRCLLGGVCGGAAVLMDYSAGVLFGGLGLYCLLRKAPAVPFVMRGLWFTAGALAPISLLWFCQWQSFGNPFLPAQHWMPPVLYMDRGYQGISLPQPDLLFLLLFDYRYGLFPSCPWLLLAFAAPWIDRTGRRQIPKFEMSSLFFLVVIFWIFLSGVNYTRLNFNSGVRYFVGAVHLLFLPAAVVLMRLPRLAVFGVVVVSITHAWCMAMYRDVERGLGVLDPVLHVFLGGFQLPVLTVLSRIGGGMDYVARGISPLPVFALAAVLIAGLWSPRLFRGKVER